MECLVLPKTNNPTKCDSQITPLQQFVISSVRMSNSPSYDRLAEKMIYFHSLLQQKWNVLYDSTAAESGELDSRIVKSGVQFCRHLEVHHDIEEREWFPILALKMEGFREGEFAKKQHKEIHRGLEALTAYLRKCEKDPKMMRKEEVRKKILWTHMRAEVEELRGENMKKYWSLEEMDAFPF